MSEPTIVSESSLEAETWSDERGHVGFRTIFGDDITTPDFTVGVADLEPGGWLGHHRHRPAEVYYVLSGRGTLSIDGTDHGVLAGTTVYIPSNSEHGIRNDGQGPLRFFYAFAVGSSQEVEYRFTARE
jgi:mannose-6-phosphate isomerase-like protein (cupin superfamily)